MFTTSLQGGIINYTDSPLLRAITYGRVIIIDEADKAPEHVVAIFRSLAGQGEMTLSDGRRVRPTRERDGDVVVHPNFRLILLANRPGYRASWFVDILHFFPLTRVQRSLATTSYKFLEKTSVHMLCPTQTKLRSASFWNKWPRNLMKILSSDLWGLSKTYVKATTLEF